MKNETVSKLIKEFVGIKTKIYSISKSDLSVYERAEDEIIIVIINCYWWNRSWNVLLKKMSKT